MNMLEIRRKQIEMGYDKMQNMIDTGMVWHMEGAMGREAMHLLEIGACFLPNKPRRGAYGQSIPSRTMLKNGSAGTLTNTKQFYNEKPNR